LLTKLLRPEPTPRIRAQGGSILLGVSAMEMLYGLIKPIVRAATRLGIAPDVFSWLSLILQGAAALWIALGSFEIGGWLLVAGASCDALDGAVARASHRASDAGEVLDAAIDRWGEMAVFFGYAYYYRADTLGFCLACAACAGAVMVSYARAKGESFGVDAKMGLMQRHERAVYLSAATIVSPFVVPHLEVTSDHPRHVLVLAALALVAIFATATSIRRTAFTRATLVARQNKT
jgi:phosphatidylglycerophosphate synthase